MTPEENSTPEILETVETTDTTPENVATETPEATTDQGRKFSHDRRGGGKGRDRNDRRDRGDRREKPKKEFDELLLEVRRVTRVTTGGRRMSFRATILVGNKKGKIGLGVSKGNDVAGAVSKATNEAYKAMFLVPITKGDTVPYALTYKYKASRVRLLPASEGTGLKAGSSIRSVLELAGYSNILSKMIGSNNKLNNALATIQALASYKHAEHFSALKAPKEEEKQESPKPKAESEKPKDESQKPKAEYKKPVEKPAPVVEQEPVVEAPVEKKKPITEKTPVKTVKKAPVAKKPVAKKTVEKKTK